MSLRSTLAVMRMFARMAGRVPAGHLWYLLRRMRFEKPHHFAGQTRINTFFPPYPSPAFDRFCRAMIERRRVPYSVYLAVTGACPFHCEHCSYAGRPAGELSRPQLLDLIGQIKQLGTSTLGLTGGEPLLRDDVEEFVAAAAPEMVTIVFTTGQGLDAKRAKRLAGAGVACVTIGIESADPAAHDAVRGCQGSFAQAALAAHVCRQTGLYLAISTVATRAKLASGELEAMYELGSRWGAGEFRILSPVATGAWRGCGAAMLTEDERRQLIDFHTTHNRRRSGPAVAAFAYLESDQLFGCGAGYHHLFIDAAGNVCPCDLTPLCFGNATAEPLADIWRRMGRHFPSPRRGCLMAEIGCHFHDTCPLPLPPSQSQTLCPPSEGAQQLPEGYRRLLR
ncbi:MAG: radical SAM protein, partial [Planctomycetes bacterium]|nr:radical SAM protein [Planctomycetota bacterium]